LTDLIGKIGEIHRIRPEQAEQIQILFGDHIAIEKDGNLYANAASCLVDFDEKGVVSGTRIILNRSEEVAKHSAVSYKKSKGGASCVFQTPRENIIWLLSEELNHAKLWLQAKTKKREAGWQLKHKQNLKRRGCDFGSDEYAGDIQEVTVSRRTVRVLGKLIPERASYFDELHRISIIRRENIAPDISDVIDNAYIKTGFRPTG